MSIVRAGPGGRGCCWGVYSVLSAVDGPPSLDVSSIPSKPSATAFGWSLMPGILPFEPGLHTALCLSQSYYSQRDEGMYSLHTRLLLALRAAVVRFQIRRASTRTLPEGSPLFRLDTASLSGTYIRSWVLRNLHLLDTLFPIELVQPARYGLPERAEAAAARHLRQVDACSVAKVAQQKSSRQDRRRHES